MGRELALVCGDGGIKGGFIAGAVSTLLDRFPNQMSNVKTIVASSASVGSMCYYLSHGLRHPGREIWLQALSSRKFIQYDSIRSIYARRPIYDIDYLVYNIFKKDFPLDVDAIRNSPIDFYFPVQNYETGDVEYFSNRGTGSFIRGTKVIKIHDMREYDIYDLIKAASAAPFVYDKCMKIGNSTYIDAANLEPYALDLPALRGKHKIVVVSKMDFSMRRNLYYYLSGALWPFLVSPFKPYKLKAEIYFQYMRKPAILERLDMLCEILQYCDDLIFIKPIKKLGGNTDNSAGVLESNFRHGEAVILERFREIAEFFDR